MQSRLKTCDTEGLERRLKAMIVHVPYKLHIEEGKLLPVWLHFLGFEPRGEQSTGIGRIDTVWKLPDMTVVAEIKYSAKKSLKRRGNKANPRPEILQSVL
jgi:hypothetical protein